MSDPLSNKPADSRYTAEKIVARAPEDLVFSMRFLGQSQEVLHNHFRSFLEARLADAGITPETHPMVNYFIDSHALELREFVVTGVALARQFRLGEIETLTGDVETQMRVDIWDALSTHIEMAEARFAGDLGQIIRMLDENEAQMPQRSQ